MEKNNLTTEGTEPAEEKMNGRALKFRVWNPQMQKMLDWDVVKGCMADILLTENEDINIPMQFTGYSDINGEDIYEGDIIKFEDVRYENKLTERTIEFVSGAFFPLLEYCGNIVIKGNKFEGKLPF